MTNNKHTKRALFASLLSMLLCVTMLIGSTFAWFTDTASTSVNRIQSGTLEIELLRGEYSANNYQNDPDNYVELSDESLISEDILWEPGYLWYDNLIVKNNGSLAAKAKAYLVATSEVGELAEVIDVYVSNTHAFVGTYDEDKNVRDYINGEYAADPSDPPYVAAFAMNPPTKVGTLAEVINGQISLGKELPFAPSNEDDTDEHMIAIALKMQETAGNEYQDKLAGSFDIVITATQDTHEEDSYNNQYDKGAAYPVWVSSQTELNDAITKAEGPTTVALPSGTYSMPKVADKEITFTGSKDTVIDTTEGMPNTNGADITFDGVTVNFKEGGSYGTNGFTHSEKVVYKDCVINGTQFLYADAEFINCTFNVSGDAYAVWTYGSKNTTFTNCTFNTSGKAILVYTEAAHTATITVKGCTFNDDDGVTEEDGSNLKKAAIEVGESAYGNKANYTVIIDDSTANGFSAENKGIATNSNLWGNKNSMDKDHLNVMIDGVDVY